MCVKYLLNISVLEAAADGHGDIMFTAVYSYAITCVFWEGAKSRQLPLVTERIHTLRTAQKSTTRNMGCLRDSRTNTLQLFKVVNM